MGKFLIQLAPYILYSVGIILIFVILSKVEWGIFFLIPILPLQTILDIIRSLPMGKDFVDILFIAIIIGWIARSLTKKEILFENTSLNTPIILFFFWTLFSLYHGFSTLGQSPSFNIYDDRIQTWKNYMLLPLIYFIIINNIKDKKKIKYLVWIMIFVMFLMSFRFFREYRSIDKSSFNDAKRWSGTFSYLGPNEYAAFFSHYVFIILGIFLLIKSKLKKAFLLLTIILNLYCIIFLFSRGSYLATIAALMLTGILRKNIVIVSFVLLLVVSWNTILPGSVIDRINMTTNENGELESSSARRIEVWKESKELFSSSPIIGIGFNTFPYLRSSLSLVLGDTHNLFFKILVEQGIIGLLIFLPIIIFSFISGWKLYRTSNDEFFRGLGFGFMICIVSLLISNFFGDRWTYIQLGAYFWAFMGLVARANIITQTELNMKNITRKK